MTLTITQAIPADADSDYLLGYLNAAPDWQYVLSFGKGEYWATTYQRAEGPFAGYKIDVPQHDEDPEWCPQVAEIINGVECGQMPACGLSSARIDRAVAAINAVCQPGRTGRATLSEAVALRDILDPWYTVTPDARHILRTIANGRPLHALAPQSVALLQVLAARLASLIVPDQQEEPMPADGIPQALAGHPAVQRGEVITETSLECCSGQHYYDPGKAYVHTRCAPATASRPRPSRATAARTRSPTSPDDLGPGRDHPGATPLPEDPFPPPDVGDDVETHMRHTVGMDAVPTALCNTSITTDLTGDVAAVTCGTCRRETYRIIAEEEAMRRQAEAESDD